MVQRARANLKVKGIIQCSTFLKLQHLQSQGCISVQRSIQNHLRIWEKFVVTFYLSTNFCATFFPHAHRRKLQRIMLLILANLMSFSFFFYNSKNVDTQRVMIMWCV